MKHAALPPGETIFFQLMQIDPTPRFLQVALLLLTGVAVILLPFIPASLAHPKIGNVSSSWELEAYSLGELLSIMESSLGLNSAYIGACFTASVAIFAFLFICDSCFKLEWQDFMCPAVYAKIFKETGTRGCYDEMFCEPARSGKLVARPGNTYSNFIYFFNGLLVTSSALFGSTPFLGPPTPVYNNFWAADLLFGLMMLCLSAFSVLWHATNLPLAHYPDLWSMDSCIAYQVLRFVLVGLHIYVFGRNGRPDTGNLSNTLIPLCCFLAFAGIVWLIGKTHVRMYEAQQLHYNCYFSGRTRLLNVVNKGDAPERFSAIICLFGGMPVVYAIPMILSQVFWFNSLGSIPTLTLGLTTLVFGWSYRMSEKFLLDCCIFMEWAKTMPASALRTIVTAIVSPTAVLHFTTGITLLAGFISCRSAE